MKIVEMKYIKFNICSLSLLTSFQILKLDVGNEAKYRDRVQRDQSCEKKEEKYFKHISAAFLFMKPPERSL